MKHLIAFLILSLALKAAFTQAPEKPNIILIIADDLNDYVEGFAGHPQVETPNLQLLEEKGTTFTNAHCSSPQCSPSRISMLTGKDVAYTKIYRNTDQRCSDFRGNFSPANNNAEIITLPEYLKDEGGYFTYSVNKAFHCHENLPDFDSLTSDICAKGLSWNKSFAFENSEDPYINDIAKSLEEGVIGFDFAKIDDSYEDQLYDYRSVDSVIQFVNNYAADPSIACDKPFFIVLGFRRPHVPLNIPEKYFSPFYFDDFDDPFTIPYNNPPYAYPYNGIVMPPQPDTLWEDYEELPDNGVAQSMARSNDVHEKFLEYSEDMHGLPIIDSYMGGEERNFIVQESERARGVMAYLASVKFIDAQIGRLYETLQTQPEILNNSIIIFISDHGYSLGEKSHWRKRAMWETDNRVPMIIVDMRNITQQVCTESVSLLDIFPTITDMIGLDEPALTDGSKYLDGVSLLPLIENPELPWEKASLSAHEGEQEADGSCFPQYSVRNNRFHYIKYASNNTIGVYECDETLSHSEEELYEIGQLRDVDPNEWNNLINDPDFDPVKNYMQQFLPDSNLYLQKTYKIIIKNNSTSCFLAYSDSLQLSFDLYDAEGNYLFPPANLSYEWSNNLTTDVMSGSEATFPIDIIDEATFNSKNRLMIYLNVLDSAGNLIAFDVKYYYLNSDNQPIVNFMADLSFDMTVCVHDYLLDGSYTNSWWDFGEGVILYDDLPGPYTYAAPGTYTITNYVQYGNSNCIEEFSRIIKVDPPDPKPEILLSSYPNPASDNMFLKMRNVTSYGMLEIYDAAGKKIDAFIITPEDCMKPFQLNISAMHPGIYFGFYLSDSGTSEFKFIVSH